MSARALGVLCLALLACEKAPATAPRPSTPEARDVPAAQGVRATPDVPAPAAAPARAAMRATVEGASADPPLREFDRAFPVPRWSGQGALALDVPSGDGPVEGTLNVGDLALRVRGYRSGETLRGALEPASVDDGGVWVWRGLLDARIAGDALRGTWSVSAHGGRYARAGTVGPR
ncbi:MAG: hypothetical protein U0325_11440 [Polyangiales bacterium]